MQKKPKQENDAVTEINDEDGAFEIIELAIDDINILTRAFQVINNICEELSADENASETEEEELDEDLHGIPEHLLH